MLSNASRSRLARVLCGVSLVLFVTLLGGVSGCGNKGGAKATVTGKVTLNNSPVAGTVSFHSADGKETTGPISADGTYTIFDPPAGKVQITVKGPPGGAGGGLVKPPPAKDAAAMPDMPGTASAGVAPPAKYATTATSDLTYEVKAGVANQTYNIELKP